MALVSGERLEQTGPPDRAERPAAEPRHAPPPATPALAGAHGPAAWSAPARGPASAAALGVIPISQLQHAAGNAAVARLLAKAPVVQREPLGWRPADELPEGYGSMSDAQKVEAIRSILARVSAGALLTAWGEIGQPAAAAIANPDLFATSVKKSPGIVDLAGFDAMREKFKTQVLNTARGYLEGNKKAVIAERERTGAGGPVGETVGEQVQARVQILTGKGSSVETNEAVQNIQAVAAQMERVKQVKAKMLATRVGYDTVPESPHAARKQYREFVPGSSPSHSEPPNPTYDTVMAEWTRTIDQESKLVKLSPSSAFFIGEGGDPTKIAQDKDVRVARAEIAVALTDLERRIDGALPRIGSGIEFEDLVPIQQELLAGPTWSKPVENAVAKAAVAQGDLENLLKTLAVSSLSAAAFLFAPLTAGTSAGLAGFLLGAGVAASGAQAAMSWEKYADLAAANRASLDPTEQLVSGEQVSAALVSAVLDTIFAVVDAWQAFGKGFKEVVKIADTAERARAAVKAGKAIGATAVLKNAAASDRGALVTAIMEVGPERAKELSGLDYRKLAEKVGGEETTLGIQLFALADRGGAVSDWTKSLLAKIPRLGALSAEEGGQVLEAGVSQFGYKGLLDRVGGWAAIKKCPAMKAGTGAAPALEAWRGGIAKELDGFITQASDKLSRAVRTGSEKASSDLDVQIMGDAAAQLQKEAEAWLAGRLETNAAGAQRLLDVTVFIDPSRAHLVDLMRDLGEDVRSQIRAEVAAAEPPLILAARLDAAKEFGKEAQERIMREMPGVTPVANFRRLSVDEQRRYAVMIDEWMQDLRDPAKVELRANRVRRIGQTQAMINASHADAYVGGGVAVWVTGREGDLAKITEALKSLNFDPSDIGKFSYAQRVSAALSEGKWIDKALHALKVPGSRNVDQLVAEILDISKHGARAADVLRVPGVTNVGELTRLMEQLRSWGSIDPRLLREVVTKEELGATCRRIEGILDGLTSQTGAAVTALQKEGQALGVDLAGIEDFQAWLRWRDRFRQYSKAGVAGVATLEGGLRAMLEAHEHEAAANTPANPQPEPAPATSVPGAPPATAP